MTDPDVTQKLAEACNAFLVPLRTRWEFREESYRVLCDVLRQCRVTWAQDELISKAAVAYLIEIEPALLSLHGDCPSKVKGRVEKALGELSDLIVRSVAPTT